MSNTTATPTGTWVADAGHSQVGFAVKHLGIANVHGTFNDFDGSIEISEDSSSIKISGTIKAESVDTDHADRDAHLRSADFFDVEQFPEIRFESTSVSPDGDDSYKVVGDLTMRGLTNEMTLDVEIEGTETDPWGNDRVGLAISGSLNRSDWEMKFNQALGSGNVLVSDKVKISLDVSAVKQA